MGSDLHMQNKCYHSFLLRTFRSSHTHRGKSVLSIRQWLFSNLEMSRQSRITKYLKKKITTKIIKLNAQEQIQCARPELIEQTEDFERAKIMFSDT